MMQPPTSPAMSGKPAATTGGALAWITLHAERVMLAAILVAVVAKFWLILRINLNWDEFYFLELTHQYASGTLTGRFQTFHVHLFSWLPALGWDVPDQIVAGRLVMAVLATASAYLTYAIAGRFVTRRGALFALLAYLSVSAVIEHGSSYRVEHVDLKNVSRKKEDLSFVPCAVVYMENPAGPKEVPNQWVTHGMRYEKQWSMAPIHVYVLDSR